MGGSGLLFTALVSCSHHDSRADAVLFESADERARRDLLALYSFGNPDTGFGCIHITQGGIAEVHFEPGPALLKTPFFRADALSRHTEGIPVDSEVLATIERIFDALPSDESTWAVVEKRPPEDSGFCPPRGGGGSSRYRTLHVSKTGEPKFVTVYRGPPGTFPQEARPAGPGLAGLGEIFLRIANPGGVRRNPRD